MAAEIAAEMKTWNNMFPLADGMVLTNVHAFARMRRLFFHQRLVRRSP
jgi:hypothetical protein